MLLKKKIIEKLKIDDKTITLIERLDNEILGEPKYIPKENINIGKSDGTKPQAWKYEVKIDGVYENIWYYNWEGALLEAKKQGKRLPTSEEWKIISKPFGKDGKLLSKTLNLPLAGRRVRYESRMGSQNTKGFYWTSDKSTRPRRSSSFNFYVNNINPITDETNAYGFPVRCIRKN